MKNVDESLENFSKVVLNKAFKVRESMEKDIDSRTKKIIEEKELVYLEEAYNKIQENKKKIIQDVNENISKKQLECKKELILKRREITDEIFKEVSGRINEFINSESYYPWMYGRADEAIKTVLENTNSVMIHLNKTDEQYVSKLHTDLKNEFPDADIEVSISDSENITGGVVVFAKDRNILIDLSIRESIVKAGNEFLKLSGMSVD